MTSEEKKEQTLAKKASGSEDETTDSTTNNIENSKKEESISVQATDVGATSESCSVEEAQTETTNLIASRKLHRNWVLWFDNPRFAVEGAPWRDNLKQCGLIKTPESFWLIYNNLKPVSSLYLNSNYHFFKQGVEPMWEDSENMNGGKFVLSVPKKENKSGRLDEMWLCTMLAIIGETLDVGGNIICGAVVSTRAKVDRIALWLKTDDKRTCIDIGEKWKKCMNIDFNDKKMTIKYQLHKEAAAAGHSFKNEVKFEV